LETKIIIMKITQSSPTVLVLKSSGIISMIVGAFLVVIGGIFLYLNFAPGSATHVGIWIPAIVIVVGVLFFLFSKSSTITFSKDQNTMTVFKSGMTGKGSKNYPLDGIAGLEIVEEYRTQTINEGNTRVTRPVLYERLSVAMKDGSRVALNEVQAGTVAVAGAVLGVGGETGMAQQMATFLGVPLSRIAPGAGMMSGGMHLPPTA
jgi:hypothetical protein